jgi:hypothetical protein
MAPTRCFTPSPGDMVMGSWRRSGLELGRVVGLLGLVGSLAVVGALTGCSATKVALQEGPREYVATDYDSVLKRWTREESLILFDELERALTVTATFQSWDFRWAYVVRYATDYRLTIPQRQRLLSEYLNETRKSHQFFIALFGSNQKQNDLTKKDSAWIVRLIDETGNETAPEQIVAVKKPNTLERRYYPYNTVWRKAFRINFPTRSSDGRPTLSPKAAWMGLRFAGAWGNTDLIWDIEDGDEKQPSETASSGRVRIVVR